MQVNLNVIHNYGIFSNSTHIMVTILLIVLVQICQQQSSGHCSLVQFSTSRWLIAKFCNPLPQTSVMHLVMETSEHFWNNSNLEQCFLRALEGLLQGLRDDSIPDIFFPEVRNGTTSDLVPSSGKPAGQDQEQAGED